MVKMSKKYDFGIKGALLAVLVAVVLNACATSPGAEVKTSGAADASAEVRMLAQSRWDALVRGDVATAYSYLSPPSRALMSLLQYQQRIRVGFWRRVEVENVTCEQEVCNVNLKITYDHRMAKGVVTPASESWVKEGGKWWFVMR